MPKNADTKTSSRQRQALSKVFLAIGAGLVFFAGFLSGSSYELSRQKLNLDDFWTAYGVIENRFVGSIDKQRAAEGATRGLIESLEDPFSGFLSKEERSNLSRELSGEFEGIGARLESKDQNITVVAPLSGSPAERSGLKPGDVILEIDDVSTEKMSLDTAVSKIRGPEGTKVRLLVFRESDDGPIELTVSREKIQVPSATWKMLGDVAYMEISQFGDDTPEKARQGFNELKAKNPTAFILDLRNNPGGYLADVAPIAGAFIPPSVVTVQKFKGERTEEIRSTELPILPNLPLFVLVNQGSASAAEILAGALKDYGRAKIIGTKTFGKGSVQDVIPIGDGSALRLTIAEWLTPKGNKVNKVGIEPDVVVEGEKTNSSDPVLDKALELARQ